MVAPRRRSTPLSAEDLAFWIADQPRQRTTMAMLMGLDRPPDPERLRAAAWRAVEAVPRLRQVVVDAPFDLARPRWEDDSTFDLDYHLRRYAQPTPDEGTDPLEALFHTVGPIYDRPFDRSRPLWEMIEIDRPDGRSAVFFRLHHAMADGVGGNAILAALTDAECDGPAAPLPPDKTPGGWTDRPLASRVAEALVHRADEEIERARRVAGAVWDAVRHPGHLATAAEVAAAVVEAGRFRSGSRLSTFGPTHHLGGLSLPFEPLRRARRALGGTTVDVLLTGVAGAMGRWHRAHDQGHVRELATLVPINLRPWEEQQLDAAVGNRATGVIVRLPVAIEDPVARFHEIHERVAAQKSHPATAWLPELAESLAGIPRWLVRPLSYQMAAATDLIVTNVTGVPTTRYLAGSRIEEAWPFAPTGPHTPVSIALYGYAGRLFVGLDADAAAMPDLDVFREMLRASFAEIVEL